MVCASAAWGHGPAALRPAASSSVETRLPDCGCACPPAPPRRVEMGAGDAGLALGAATVRSAGVDTEQRLPFDRLVVMAARRSPAPTHRARPCTTSARTRPVEGPRVQLHTGPRISGDGDQRNDEHDGVTAIAETEEVFKHGMSSRFMVSGIRTMWQDTSRIPADRQQGRSNSPRGQIAG